jgi:hypothetical protein
MTHTASFTRGILRDRKRNPQPLLRTAAVTAAFLTTGLMWLAASSASASERDGTAWMYDVDGIGGVDSSASDTTGPWGFPDGYLDENYIVLPTPEGGRLAWLVDHNQNNRPEQVVVDGNNDGKADVWLYDDNEDVVMDRYWTDPAVYAPVNIITGQPGGTTLVIINEPLGSNPGLVIPDGGGIVTNPCAPFTWTLPDNMKCTS